MEDRQQAFGEALAGLCRQARENGGVIADERVREAFADFALDDAQMASVYAYLKENHIGVGEAPDAEEYLTEKERDALAGYAESLKALPSLTERERARLAARAAAGDKEAGAAFAESMLPVVPDIARLYVQQGVLLEDLIGEGNVALWHGASLLGALADDTGEEALLAGAERALSRCVMDAMEAYIADNLQEDARGQRAVNRVNEVADRAKELYEDLRRPVTVGELANETGWSREKIVEAWKLAGGKIEELAAPDRDGED